MKKTKAQVSLEMASAFIIVLLLLFAGVKLSLWLLNRMGLRQASFENTRASSTDPRNGAFGAEVIETPEGGYVPLKFFGEGSQRL